MAPKNPSAPSEAVRKPEVYKRNSDDNLSVRSLTSCSESRDEIMSIRSVPEPKRTVTPPVRLEGLAEGMRGESAMQYCHRRGLNGYATVVQRPEGGEDEVLHPNQDWLEQFAIIVMKRKNPSAEGGSWIERLRIQSPLIKAALSETPSCKDYPGFAAAKSMFNMYVDAPFDCFFYNWNAIIDIMEDHHDPETREHFKILYNILLPFFEKLVKRVEESKLTGHITYEWLWTLFKPGHLIYRKDFLGRELIEKVQSTCDGTTKSGEPIFKVRSESVCWDGTRFGIVQSVGGFHDLGRGVMSISDLPAIPFDMHPNREAIRARVLKRALKYASLTKCELKEYVGPHGELTHERKQQEAIQQIGDRLMLNPTAVGCSVMPKNLEPLVKENFFEDHENGYQNGDRLSSPGSLRRQRERRCVTDLRKARDEWSKSDKNKKPLGDTTLSEEQLLITVPDVPVCDLRRKTWALIDVDDIGDVNWNEDAYNDIIFPEAEKELVISIASGYATNPVTPITVPERRSKGTSICLAGPSGNGKVCLVEAIAEKLHAPLYHVDMAEIIRDWDGFEDHMLDELQRCQKWGAITLVTNIDLLLQSNDSYNRLDTASTFVHHMSTHPGLVFFTATGVTKRFPPILLDHFDLLIDVPALDENSRRQVWEEAIHASLPLKQRNFRSHDIEALAQHAMSAREIKSALKMALMLAKSKGQDLHMDHMESVIEIKLKGKLKAKGKEDEAEEDKSDEE